MINNLGIWDSPVAHAGEDTLLVVAVDPGETIGLCWARVNMLDLLSFGPGDDLFHLLAKEGRIGGSQIRCAPVAGMHVDNLFGLENQAVHKLTEGLLHLRGLYNVDAMHIVIEDFILRRMNRERALLSPVRVTAMLYAELLRAEFDMSVHLQQPSDAMTMVTDEQLKSFGLWYVGREHARAAARHLVLYLRSLYGSV